MKGKIVTEKINSALDQISPLTKIITFLIGIITLAGLMFSIFIYPAMSKIAVIEKEIIEIKSNMNKKTDQNVFDVSINNINKNLDDIKQGVESIRGFLLKGIN